MRSGYDREDSRRRDTRSADAVAAGGRAEPTVARCLDIEILDVERVACGDGQHGRHAHPDRGETVPVWDPDRYLQFAAERGRPSGAARAT